MNRPPQPPHRFGPPPGPSSRPQPRPQRPGPPQRAAVTPPPRPTPRRKPPTRPVQRRRKPARRLKLGALHGRLRFGFAAVCTLLLVIGGRLVQLQGLDHGKYATAASDQRLTTIALPATRGEVVDRNGTVLAYSAEADDITADPQMIAANQRWDYAQKLSPLIGTSVDDIVTALSQNNQYQVLAHAVSPVVAEQVSDLVTNDGLAGIYTDQTSKRLYPGGTTAANILGTVHSDGTGAAGIEQEFNTLLQGKAGSETYSVDNTGNINPSSRTVTQAATNGATITLTIDQQLQYTAQQMLDEAVPASGAKDAEMAILDAHSGQVLALASSGTFDANNPDSINPNAPIDPPVMSAFEPGSVQKAITFAAALQTHKITPQEQFTVPNQIDMGGVTVGDAWWHPTEPFTATGILAESSNVGTLKIAQILGPQLWDQYEKKFGVGQATGIELPGESSGYLPSVADWSGSSFSNLPFGQGESMTVLQLASIYQTIANNGVRVPPRIVESIKQADGTVTPTKSPGGIEVISPETAKTLRTMLESVIMAGGTGVKAAVPGYRVAGKTGTAQQPDPNTGRYSDTMNWDTFAGMIPADNPQIVVAIMVDNPAHGVEGGDVAAPLFNQIASYEVQHAHIPPTGSIGKHVPLENCKNHVVWIDSPHTVC